MYLKSLPCDWHLLRAQEICVERKKEQMNNFREKAEMCATHCPERLARQRDNFNETESR